MPVNLQLQLHALPESARPVGSELAVVEQGDQFILFNAGGPVAVCNVDDVSARYLLAIRFSEPPTRLASAGDLARALKLQNAEVARRRRRFHEEGLAGLVLSPKGPGHQLHAHGNAQAQALLEQGVPVAEVARQLGVTPGALYQAFKAGRIKRPSPLAPTVTSALPAAESDPQTAEGETPAELVFHDSTVSSIKVGPEVGPEDVPNGSAQEAEAPAQPSTLVTSPLLDCEPPEQAPTGPTTDLTEAPDRAARDREDGSCAGGMAVKRLLDRELARQGKLLEAPPHFEPAFSVEGGGALLALPALIDQGLYEVFSQVYGRLKGGYYGLFSVLSTLAFMALLRVRSSEGLSRCKPGELGRLLGLDRAPEMKTLRRKLLELKEMGLSLLAMEAFAVRFTTAEPEQMGVLYIDGHVRAYHGKHRLPETMVARRRLCMPATTDYWVHGSAMQPLFFVTAEANEHMQEMLVKELLPRAKQLAGGARRLLLVFDRDGWSPKFFRDLAAQGVDILTYRKGRYEAWPEEEFKAFDVQVSGKPGVYRLAERGSQLLPGFWVKEVRRLCDNGHQTAIVTTGMSLETRDVALRMFGRWGQENYFRYARMEYGLDLLPTYEVEEARALREVPNPRVREKQRLVQDKKKARQALLEAYGAQAREAAEKAQAGATVQHTARSLATEQAEALSRVSALEAEIDALKAESRQLPKRVPIAEVLGETPVVRLETERKRLMDLVRLLCYRAETQLANLVGPLLPGRADEARSFLKRAFALSADLLPEPSTNRLRIRLHSMSTWRENRALAGLSEYLNALKMTYPGTSLVLTYDPPRLPDPAVPPTQE